MLDRTEKLKYPKSVFFIISNEFCERFSYYGLRTILTIYLTYQLKYGPDTSTIIYHIFTMLCYFFPLIGAIIADNWLGKFKTIFFLSIIYSIGNIVVATGAVPFIGLDATKAMTIIGLLLIAVGTGGIKPCVSAFGGDQFVLPQQQSQLEKYFSLFYFAINAGSFISTFLTPVLREDVTCFQQPTCYSLAFGVPAALMIASLVIFLIGKPFYKIRKPEGNILLKVCQCIGHAVSRSFKKVPAEHWLDRSEDKYDKKFINDIKVTLRVLLLFVPLPIFWALFDQQGSRWTFQATRMTGKFPGFTLKPDQMQVINPLLILVYIPLFETFVYPTLAKCGMLKKPLQKMVAGGALAALAFFLSAGVETFLEPTYAILPKPGESQLLLHNTLDCPVILNVSGLSDEQITIPPLAQYPTFYIPMKGSSKVYKYSGRVADNCSLTVHPLSDNNEIVVFDNQASSYIITIANDSLKTYASLIDNIDKSDSGEPRVRIMFTSFSSWNISQNVTFVGGEGTGDTALTVVFSQNNVTNFHNIVSNRYMLKVNGEDVGLSLMELDQGGVYSIAVFKDGDKYTNKLTQVTSPNTVNMLWLIPQYVVITAGEIMFSVTGLEFAFTQAPVTMKSVLTSAWLLTVAFGNLVVVIIAEAKFFESQTHEFLLFASLMIVDMIIFALMAIRYKYVENSQEEPTKDKGEEINQNEETDDNIILREKF